MLSPIATELARWIKTQDWSDSPWRLDRAGHRHDDDSKRGPRVLSPEETYNVRWNVAATVRQALQEIGCLGTDPTGDDAATFFQRCDVRGFGSDGKPSGWVKYAEALKPPHTP